MLKEWLKERKQFIIAAVVFSLLGTGVTFALPYVPSDAELDPTCAPGDVNCYVALVSALPALASGSVAFSDGATFVEDNTNFIFNDSTNQLYAKYVKSDSVEYLDSSFSKAYKVFPNATYGVGVFMGKNLFSASGLSITSSPTDVGNLPGGVVIGESILSSAPIWATSGSVYIGNGLLNSATSDATVNVMIGSQIGGTGEQNQGVFLGFEVLGGSASIAGYNGSSGHKNVAIGRQSMYRTNGGLNTAVGALSLARLTTGSGNTAVGAGAGNGVTNSILSALTGSNNTFLGLNTTWSVDAISNATAVGANVTLSQSNTVILGNSADVGIGTSTPTFKLQVTGGDASFNTVRVGLGAGGVTTNTAVGYQTLNSNTTGEQNTAVGYQTLYTSVSALQNTAIGYTALYSNTGNGNTAIGYRNMYTNIGGVDNTSLGKQSLENNNSGVSNTAIGVYALRNNNSSSGNTAIGVNALYSNSTTGYNTAVGTNALYNNTGLYNTGIGGNVLYSNTTGNYNIGMGLNALRSNIDGSNNVSLGYQSGYNSGNTGTLDNNIFIGYQAANNATSGAGNNIIIGYDIDLPTAGGDNQMSIGNLIFGTGIDGTDTTLSTGNVGIGTSSPRTKLEIGGDGAILASGTYGSGWVEPDLGAGTRMIWYPSKAAFRAGNVDGSQWDNINIGDYSVAFGRNSTASGDYSFAGGRALADSYTSFAFGEGSATETGAVSFGDGDSSGEYSFSLGNNGVIASGPYSFAFGEADASGDHAVAFGYSDVSGNFSFGFGSSTISASDSYGFGDNTISGNNSFASGDNNDISARYASAFGQELNVSSFNSFVVGRYNVGGGTTSSWVGTDSLFEIGIGTSAIAKANALTVFKDGRVVFTGDINTSGSISNLGSDLVLDGTGDVQLSSFGGTVFRARNSGNVSLVHLLIDVDFNNNGVSIAALDSNPTLSGTNTGDIYMGSFVPVINAPFTNSGTIYGVYSDTTGVGGTNYSGIFLGGNFGIGTSAPTHSLTLNSTNTGITSYNTSDQVTNYERIRQFWSGNTFYINSEKGGTGTDRNIIINGVTFQSGGFTGFVNADWLTVTNVVSPASGLSPLVLTGTPVRLKNFTSAISSGSIITTDINPDINQSGTAGYTGLRISAYEQTTGSGPKYFMDVGTNTAAEGAGTHTSLFNIDNTGKVGILDPTPEYRLDVEDSAAVSYVAGFFNDGNNDNRWGIVVQAGADTPSANRWIQFNDGDGTDQGSICYTGGQANICAPSDMRLKKDIVDTSIGLNSLLNIKVRDFVYISDGENRVVHGFIAQELFDVYPDAVSRSTDPNEMWKVSYNQLTPLVIKSIQELDLKLADLTSFDTVKENSLANRIKTFLSDVTNGIEKIFAREIETKKLCVADDSGNKTCITKSELDAVLLQASINNLQNNPAPEPTPDPVPENEPTPDPEPVPVPETNPEILIENNL